MKDEDQTLPSKYYDTGPSSDKPAAKKKAAAVASPKVGDHVLYVMSDGAYPGEARPAVIVRAFGDTPDSYVNLQVFTDGLNDYVSAHPGATGLVWKSSVLCDEDEKLPGTYHRTA